MRLGVQRAGDAGRGIGGRQGVLMWAACLPAGWNGGEAFGHPASGIVVAENGDVYFIHTGRGVGRIDAAGKLSYVHQVTGGGHFPAIDEGGRFSRQFPRLFERLPITGQGATLLYASGGGPMVVNRDGNLYYGSGYPEGDDTAPGFLTVTRLSLDGKRVLFAPRLKPELAGMNEGVTGLAAGHDGCLYVACPNAIIRVKPDGTVTTVVHPVAVKDRADDLAKDSHTSAYHSPYLRGPAVADDGSIYAAVTGCRCVVKITPAGDVETVLKSEKPWTPTGVAVRGGDVFVLEYRNPDKPTDWVPRVRKLGADGGVRTLADSTRGQ